MFWSKPVSYVGIDLGAGGVKLVELREEKKRPVLFTYGLTSDHHDVHRILSMTRAASSEKTQAAPTAADVVVKNPAPTPASNQEKELVTRYAALVSAVMKKVGVKAKKALVNLPVSAVFHTIVTLPITKKEEFDHLLRVEVQKLLPYKLDEASVEYEILSQNKEAQVQRILVHAVPNDLLAFYTAMMERAGFKRDDVEFETESVALVRSLVGRDPALSMIIDMGAERTSFFIVEEAKPITHHSIEVGGDKINKIIQSTLAIENNLVEQVKHDMFDRLMSGQEPGEWSRETFLDLFTPILDPILKEIEYSFDLYLRQSGNEHKRPEKIILTGGAAFFPYLTTLIAEKFALKCYVGDPWGRVVYQDALRAHLQTIGPRMSIAIGLALQKFVKETK